ncbi:MAG TPA: MaoC/PaaZ C-terminal domain-containing protein [Burkholderiaceae bacterium]
MIDPDRLMAEPLPRIEQTIGWRDCILYALGLGVGLDPLDETDLPFVDERRLQVAPTMANVMGYPGFWMSEPRFGIDFEKTVHGEHAIRLHRPLPSEARVVGTSRITGLVDKGAGKGALIYVEREITDAASGALLATVRQTVFCRGDGGFGGTRGEAPAAPAATPERAPDATIDVPTSPQGALIYRLSGDHNPLHFDPAAARRAGFPGPILHGLATFGVAGHGLVKALCGGAPENLIAMGGRFSSPVYPGETVRVEAWRSGGGRAAFRARVPARDVVVMSHGFVEVSA